MSEIVKTETEVHPADALAAALNRASVLLAALSDLYDRDQEEFVGGNSFILHGVTTATELLEEAGRALADLHDRCDLNLVKAATPTDEAESSVLPPIPKMETAKAIPKPPPTIAEAVVTLQEGSASPEEAANSYRELLGKIAKVEANGAMTQSPVPNSATAELLPMLRALRKEIQKASGAA